MYGRLSKHVAVNGRFVCPQITITVLRHEKPAEEIEVELQKKPGKGAGFCMRGFVSGKGAYVWDLVSYPFPLSHSYFFFGLTAVL